MRTRLIPWLAACFPCSVEAWAETGAVAKVTVTVVRAGGRMLAVGR